MATIGSITSSASSSAYTSNLKGIGGLASGLDTDSLIEGMTLATRTKIAKQKQSKTLLTWKTDAYRSVSSKLLDIANKYTSFTSSTNLYSDSFFGRSKITATGDNSKYVSVTGASSSNSNITIAGVKQLAENATYVSGEAVSVGSIQTGEINFTDSAVSTIEGKSLRISFGSETYTVTIPAKEGGGLHESAEDVAAAINKAMEETDVSVGGENKKLSDLLSVSSQDGKLSFVNNDTGGNTVKIEGGDTELLDTLGLTAIKGKSLSDGEISSLIEDVKTDKLTKVTSFADKMKDKSLTFEYNGVKKNIVFDDETMLTEEKFMDYLKDKLDSAFGKGRISVTEKNGALVFETTKPSGGPDSSSVLKITSGSTGLLGEQGVFGIGAGSSNKVNQNAALSKSGLQGAADLVDEDGIIRINGKEIKIENFDVNKTSVADILSAINKSDAGVKISYMENTDKFSVVATQDGAAGSVELGENGNLNGLEKILFGKDDGTLNGAVKAGQDAIVSIDFDGEGGAEAVEITRGTNSFTLDGLGITVNGKFGYEGDNVVSGQEIKLTSSVDADKILNAVKDFIKDYNDIVEFTNSAVQEKTNRNYAPLTDEQRSEMTESQIKDWETEAKKGLLFNDSSIRSLTDELRNMFIGIGSSGLSLEDIGIKASTDWRENGKLTLDEEKFKTAVTEHTDDVKNLFNAEASGADKGGIMTRMKGLTDKYVATTGATKGILIERAGHTSSPASMLKNSLLSQMNEIDKVIERLEASLKAESLRYQNQFTALESLVQKMNVQSGWLIQQFGSNQ